MTDRRVWIVRGAILGSIALTGAAVVGAVLDRLEAMSAPVPTVRGARLGMTPDELRALRGGAEWTTSAEASGDLALERAGERYEFHEGQLVAATIDLDARDPEATGPARTLSPSSVLVRVPSGATVRLRLVSRDCPTHADEARRLADGP